MTDNKDTSFRFRYVLLANTLINIYLFSVLQPGEFPDDWNQYGHSTLIFSVFSGSYESPDCSLPPVKFRAEDHLPKVRPADQRISALGFAFFFTLTCLSLISKQYSRSSQSPLLFKQCSSEQLYRNTAGATGRIRNKLYLVYKRKLK